MEASKRERLVNALLAWTFVVIWGSGFVATKVALQYTSPLVFLTIRFGLGVLCLGVFACFTKLNWPRQPRQWLHIIVAACWSMRPISAAAITPSTWACRPVPPH